MTTITKRQWLIRNNFTEQALSRLIDLGIVAQYPRGLFPLHLDITEPEHYVSCGICGLKFIEITDRHLATHGTNLVSYVQSVSAVVRSNVSVTSRKRSQETKEKQKVSLLKFYATPEGDKVRARISESQKTLLRDKPELLQFKISTLRSSYSPENASAFMSKRWREPGFRSVFMQRVAENIQTYRDSAHNARSHRKTTSAFHLRARDLLQPYFETKTEYPCGYYKLDEAVPRFRIALEFDGCYWHGCDDCNQKGINHTLDKRKNSFLVNRGWLVLRISHCKFKSSPEGFLAFCLDNVREWYARHYYNSEDQGSFSTWPAKGEIRHF